MRYCSLYCRRSVHDVHEGVGCTPMLQTEQYLMSIRMPMCHRKRLLSYRVTTLSRSHVAVYNFQRFSSAHPYPSLSLLDSSINLCKSIWTLQILQKNWLQSPSLSMS